MVSNDKMIAFAYYRLSIEEVQSGESASINNQRMLVTDYCRQNNILLFDEFIDDGQTGANFNRPSFIEMIERLKTEKVNVVLTKDLSRLGRDMVEASFYAEKYFPEHNIRYIATHDNFDSAKDNIMAPFQFAMNEVYLRDSSRKIKNVLVAKRERGEYCACPPYGYRKDLKNRSSLIPDENTAPIVLRIFESAANGDSTRKIAMELTNDGVITPLKYRVFFRDEFSEKNATRVSDEWNYTTVKRILKNEVYLGHTILGKSQKVSIKSNKKINLPSDKWQISRDTHPPIITQIVFDLAQLNMGRGTKNYQQYEHVRKSIFSGLVKCELCGYSLCSAGTVYKGEREKYWYLSCTHRRADIPNSCSGTSIKYADLLETVRIDLNYLVSLSDKDKDDIIQEKIDEYGVNKSRDALNKKIVKAKTRIETIDKIIAKLYQDNIEGKLSNERLVKMVDEFENETSILKKVLVDEQSNIDTEAKIRENYDRFFSIVNQYSEIKEVNREILETFIDKILIGPKVFPNGYCRATHDTTPFTQNITIYYKFVGQLHHSEREELERNGNMK